MLEHDIFFATFLFLSVKMAGTDLYQSQQIKKGDRETCTQALKAMCMCLSRIFVEFDSWYVTDLSLILYCSRATVDNQVKPNRNTVSPN